MELVYLWVEDYKNIQKQGFNFSSRFECKFYDEYEEYIDMDGEEQERLKENCKLEIKPKENIKNFFDEKGKINITAIVGKNGSGKSSILSLLENYLILNNENSFFLVYFYDDKLYYFEEYITIKTELKKREFENFDYMFYNAENPYPFLEEEKYHDYINNTYDDTEFSVNNTTDNIVTFDKHQLLLKGIHPSIMDAKITSFMLVPYRFHIEDINLRGLASYVLEKIENSSLFSSELHFHFSFEDLKEYFFDGIIDGFSILKQLLILDYIFKEKKVWKLITSLKSEFSEKGIEILDLMYFLLDNFYKNLENNFKDFLFILEDKVFILNALNVDIKNKLFYDYQDFIKFDYEDSKSRKFSDLSHGEKSIYGIMINLQYKIINSMENSFLFYLDEPDLSLHPEWQRKFFFELLTNIKKENRNIHFIVTSHSPFLISDIPKQNIIFLDKDEKGNCKVVDGLKEKKQTFGANIHTLLSDSFFMEDGLMGEFAKGKVDDVINYLHGKESQIKNNDEAQKLIHIIGEPIVKNQLQRMLDSKRLKKVDEIDAIKQSMLAMQQRLDELEK